MIHARNQHRWAGPLDEVSLSRYERDGFLWFDGFFSQERVAPFFFVYNSVDNQLEEPFAAPRQRPEFLGTRRNVTRLAMHDEYPELAGQGVKPLS
ncbi:MAG: hypothetical protein U5R48_13985 [Gammaproteobacteria bacterium]|nr:hypothetical protein [Gammaproteobacteria bacterium]